jgi:hypothetical protein
VTRQRLLAGLVALLIIGAGVWLARNTYWANVTEVVPMSGAAAENEYYSLEHLANALGMRTEGIDLRLGLPPRSAVLYVAEMPQIPPTLPAQVMHELEAWVQEGGRLVLANGALLASKELQQWSEISFVPVKRALPVRPKPGAAADAAAGPGATSSPIAAPPAAPASVAAPPAGALPRVNRAPAPLRGPVCRPYRVAEDGIASGEVLQVCSGGFERRLVVPAVPEWSLSDHFDQPSVVRVRIGRGSVTVAGSSQWYSNKTILTGEFARLFFAATGLRRGDALYWIKLTDAETLLAKLWRVAAPAVLVLALALVLAIWRAVPRFGPMTPAAPLARRSLAEQIRAHARFAWRTRRLDALHRAARRAVEDTARRYIPAYDRLTVAARIEALARRSGVPAAQIETALTHSAGAAAEVQREALEGLQRLRRALQAADLDRSTRKPI